MSGLVDPGAMDVRELCEDGEEGRNPGNGILTLNPRKERHRDCREL